MVLPNIPEPGGAPSLSAPDFSPLDLPDAASAGIDVAVEVQPDLPDFIFDLG
jgi:hypothetical protein